MRALMIKTLLYQVQEIRIKLVSISIMRDYNGTLLFKYQLELGAIATVSKDTCMLLVHVSASLLEH